MKIKLLILFLINLTVFGQTLPIKPLSDKYTQNMEDIHILQMPSFNNDSLYRKKNDFEDSLIHSQRFAFGIPFKMDLKGNLVQWQNYDNHKILLLKFHSDSSLGFKFRFSKFRLPSSARIFIYPPDKFKVYGAFTDLNNRPTQDFITQEIPFRDVILEINIDIEDYDSLKLELDQIAYVFQSENFQKYHSLQQGLSLDACHINVVCPDPNNLWCNEVRSVIKLEIPVRTDAVYSDAADYSRCSGALLNNKNNDFTNYLITAQHCVEDGAPAQGDPYNFTPFLNNAVITFNWNSPTCSPTSLGNDQMTLVGLSQLFQSGWRKCGGDWFLRCPDLTLLRINVPMRWDYNVYYSGWNMSTTMSDFSNNNVATIHHPYGDVKKFASGIGSDDMGGGPKCDKNDCWNAGFFVGGVQPGSSGCPLFGNDRKVIGVLHGPNGTQEGRSPLCIFSVNGGPPTEGATIGTYGKLGCSSAQTSLKAYLSPGWPDEHDLSGLDPLQACIDFIELYGQLYPGNDYQLKNQIRVQASYEMLLGKRATLLDGSGIPGNLINKCDYVLTATNRIQIRSLGGFSITYGNKMSLRIEPCMPFTDCGFNHEDATFIAPNDLGGSVLGGINEPLSPKKFSETKMVNLFPSPSSNFLNLEANGIDGETRIVVKNILGVEVFSTNEIFNNSYTKIAINTSNYVNGIYFLQLINLKGELISINKFSIVK